MDNPTTLLTAIMFVTILGMAIGNLIVVCAEIAGGLRKPAPERIHLSWIILLLLGLLGLFWKTTLLLDIEDWVFGDFLYMILGPILAFFAASIVGVPPSDGQAGGEHSQYLELSGRFFLMLTLYQAWLIGVDLTYDTIGVQTIVNGLMLALFVLLTISKNFSLHVVGAVVAWFGFVGQLGLQATS
jgi:hypothetical protein